MKKFPLKGLELAEEALPLRKKEKKHYTKWLNWLILSITFCLTQQNSGFGKKFMAIG
jgi:hypothetical protein